MKTSHKENKEKNMTTGATEETKVTEVTEEVTEEVTQNDLMEVDLGGGVKATLPIDDAKKFISWKDERQMGYKQLESNYELANKSINELSEKSKLLESVKESQYDEIKGEIETRLKGEYDNKITLLNNKLIGTSVDAAIASNESLVSDKSARNDLRQLFLGSVEVTEDTDIAEKLNEFVKEKPHFLRAQKEEATPPVTKSKITSPTPQPSYSDAIRGLFNL